MKIIGKTDDGFILEAKEHEVAKLIGYHSTYQVRKERGRDLDVGDQINVAAMYGHLYELGREHRNIRDTASKLRTAANLLDVLPDPITEAEAGPDSEDES